MRLPELFTQAGWKEKAPDVEVSSLADNSREVQQGSLFIAYQGVRHHGLAFLSEAVQKGASAVLTDEEGRKVASPIPKVIIPQLGQRVLSLGLAWWDNPHRSMTFLGVTGTNGKTTTAHLLSHLLAGWGKVTCLGTTGYYLPHTTLPATHTTPPPLTLARLLSQAKKEGCQYVAMEVSSHALDQGRVNGLSFSVGIFLNLQHDHLDYHKTKEAYREAKAHLLDLLSPGGVVIANVDDPFGVWIQQRSSHPVLSFGKTREADHRIGYIRMTPRKTTFALTIPPDTFRIATPLLGDFNVYNTTASLLACHSLGIPLPEMLPRLQSFPGVPGRMERVPNPLNLEIFIDYAHTPEAVERVLKNVKKITKKNIIVVSGAGGNRDKEKRVPMGFALGKGADIVILTSDNPRDEDPAEIARDLLQGVKATGQQKVLTILDRKQAIRKAVKLANPFFAICLLGKGHEPYQVIGQTKHPWSEREEVLRAVEEKGHAVHV